MSSSSRRVLVSAVPFAQASRAPLKALENAGVAMTINPKGVTLSEADMLDLVPGHEVIVAGTEPITEAVMDRAPGLKLISRVGIGLDSVDLDAARQRGIRVSYTPDEPAPAVAELTVGLMIDLLRFVSVRNLAMRQHDWARPLGRRLSHVTVGLIGMGRIGTRVARHLGGFGTRILACDIVPDHHWGSDLNLSWVDHQTVFEQSDVVSLHLPLTPASRGLVNEAAFKAMRSDAVLVNTARGGLIDETALYSALTSGQIAGAAMDVFEREPYEGPLNRLDNCVLTCHLGSCTEDCHTAMELRAAEEAVRYFAGEPLTGLIPDSAYDF